MLELGDGHLGTQDKESRSRWPSGLSRGSAAALLLGLWV